MQLLSIFYHLLEAFGQKTGDDLKVWFDDVFDALRYVVKNHDLAEDSPQTFQG